MADLQGETPRSFALVIAMNAIMNSATAIDEWIDENDKYTAAQFRGIMRELAKTHNRLGERWEKLQPGGGWSPMEIPK